MNWTLLLFSYLTLFSVGLMDNSRGPIFPLILNHFGVDHEYGSLFFSVTALSAVGSSLLARWWLPGFGLIRSLRLFLLIQSIGFFLLGYFAQTTTRFPLFLFAAGLYGFGAGALSILVNIMASQATDSKHHRRALSGLHSNYGIASFLAPIAWQVSIATGLSWTVHYELIGLLAFLLFLASFFRWTFTNEVNTEQTKREKQRAPLTWLSRQPYGFMLSFYVAAEILVSSRLVIYLEQVQGLSSTEASIYLTLFFAFLLVGRLFFAVKSIRGSVERWLIVSLVTTAVAMVFGLLIHPIGLALCGLTMSYFFPCAVELFNHRFQKQSEFMMASAMVSICLLLMIMHQVTGWVADHFGLLNAMATGLIYLALSFGLLLHIRRVSVSSPRSEEFHPSSVIHTGRS